MMLSGFNVEALPSARFISGVTGGIRFVGVCIPWKDAHVRTGAKNRVPWQDYIAYCKALKGILCGYAGTTTPVCILGDFNQRIPRVSQPLSVANTLYDAIPLGYIFITEGLRDSEGRLLIDHITTSPGLSTADTAIIPRFSAAGLR